MKTDYVDVMQLHNPAAETGRAGRSRGCFTGDESNRERCAGSVASSTLPHITTYINWGIFSMCFQIPYSALERQHEKVISQAAQAGAGIIDRGGGGKRGAGCGSGQYGSLAEIRSGEAGRTARGRRVPHKLSCYAFLLSHPDIHTTIVGTLIFRRTWKKTLL